MMPQAGGPYVYLRAAYGPLPAFLFGWTEFLVVRAGSMATLAAAFARYFVQLVPPPRGDRRTRSGRPAPRSLAIAVVTAVNVLGHAPGRHAPGRRHGAQGRRRRCAHDRSAVRPRRGHGREPRPALARRRSDRSVFTGMMAAMVGVLWAYDGWINITPLAEEVRDPGRNIPRALILGMAIADRRLPGDDAGLPLRPADGRGRRGQHERGRHREGGRRRLLPASAGQRGVVAISLLVMCSTFISLNGNALTGPRAYFAMARDGLFPRGLGRIHPRFQTPANAILSQGIWAILLTVAGTALIVIAPPGPDQRLARPGSSTPGRS